MTTALLSCRGIRAGYGDAQVLHGIDLDVEAGSITALLGSNGAGKTTLMRVLSGLLPARGGTMTFDGSDLPQDPADRVAAGLSLVPEGRLVFPDLTVHENLRLGGYTPRARGGAAGRLTGIYDAFPRLAERRAQLAGTLSGGEQQMLALGRGLMSAPKLILLDEPSLGLAPQTARQVFEAIVAIRGSGISVLIVEQDLVSTLRFADTGYVMENGRIAQVGPAADLRADPAIAKSYLGI